MNPREYIKGLLIYDIYIYTLYKNNNYYYYTEHFLSRLSTVPSSLIEQDTDVCLLVNQLEQKGTDDIPPTNVATRGSREHMRTNVDVRSPEPRNAHIPKQNEIGKSESSAIGMPITSLTFRNGLSHAFTVSNIQ